MKTLLIISIIIGITLCTTGVDVSQYVSSSTTNCFKQNGQSFLIARGYCSYGGIDPNAKSSLTNGKNSGLITDAYHFPCKGKVSAQAQADAIVGNLGSLVGTYWIDVEYNPSSGCGWTDASSNCSFLSDLVSAFQNKGVLVGIYASYSQWQSIFGSSTACSNFSHLPLWYAHYDNSESFSDFTPFGGWTQPNMKQYKGDVTLCSSGVDMNWY